MYTATHITRQTQILGALFGIACILAGMYVYFVNVTVHNVVARRTIEHDIALVATEVSQLESHYIDLKSSVTLDLAKSRGFAQADQERFVERAPLVSLR